MPLKKYQKTNIFDIDNAQTLNGYITNDGYFSFYQTNGVICIPITNGATYDISGIVRVNASTAIKYATFSSIPIVDTMSIRYGTFAQSETLSITAGTNENYILIMFCGDSDYSAYGSVQNAFTINCANMQVKTLQWTDIPYRRYETETDVVTTLPVTLYTDGQPIAANLFNSATVTEGYFVRAGNTTAYKPLGNIEANVNYNLSDYIPVESNATYTIRYPVYDTVTGAGMVFYSDNLGTTISGTPLQDQSKTWTFTTPSDCTYIRFSYKRSSSVDYNKVMLNKGSTALPYQPYAPWVMKGNTEISETPSPSDHIIIDGVGNKTANLCNVTSDTSVFLDLGTGSGYGYTINADKTITNPEGKAFYGGFRIKVKPNTTYTCHCVASNNGQMRLAEYSDTITDLSTNRIKTTINVTIKQPGQGYGTVPFTTTAETKWVLFYFYIDGTYSPYTLSDIMFLEGEYDRYTIPDYIPYGYKIPISANSTALTPVYLTEQLMKIGNYADSLDSNGTVTYNIRKVVVTGEEAGWTQDGTYGSNNRYRLYLSNVKNTGTYITDFYNSHFKVQEGYAANTSVIWYGSSQYVYISVPSSDYPTLTDFKTWLQGQYAAGTPVIVYYLRATPTTETVTVPTIPTTGGEVTLDVDTTVKPSELDLTYHGWHEHEPKKKSANLFTKTGATDGKYIDASGNEQDSTSTIYQFAHTALLPINPSDEYTFSLVAQVKSVGTNHRIIGYDENGDYIAELANLVVGANEFGNKYITFNTTANCHYITINYVNTYYPNVADLNIMLNEGSTALPYAPYWE